MVLEKVVGMMDEACDAFSRYVQTAELLHRQWTMMSWILTLLSNARVAPGRLKDVGVNTLSMGIKVIGE